MDEADMAQHLEESRLARKKKTVSIELPEDTEIVSKKTENPPAPAVPEAQPANAGAKRRGGAGKAGAGTDGVPAKPVEKIKCDICGEEINKKLRGLHMAKKHGIKKTPEEKAKLENPAITKTGGETAEDEEPGIADWIEEHLLEVGLVVLSVVGALFFLWLSLGGKRNAEDIGTVQEGTSVTINNPGGTVTVEAEKSVTQRAVEASGLAPLGFGENAKWEAPDGKVYNINADGTVGKPVV